MNRTSHPGPKLPQALLDKVNGPNQSANGHHRKDVSRKDKRKADRQEKKSAHTKTRSAPLLQRKRKHVDQGDKVVKRSQQSHTQSSGSQQSRTQSSSNGTALKSILKRPVSPPTTSESDIDDASASESEAVQPMISAATKRQLEEDDAEIAALEKKLGIRGKKSKTLQEDGLDGLTNDSAGSEDEGDISKKRKRAEYDDWLASKRRNAAIEQDEQPVVASDEDEDDEGDEDSDMEGLANPFSDDELSSDDFDDSDTEDEKPPPAKRKRENPYVAPVSKSAAKYVPPSLRRLTGPGEDLTQLKRQVQGQLNRLSEANFLAILSSVEDIYTKNARQHVTSTLLDLFMGMITSPSTLSEPFLILHSAFATAIFKVIGPDFGAQLLERTTEAVKASRESQGKEELNLLGFLSNMYIMQMIGPTIIFDYIRGLLSEISENNAELLLRIIRTAGTQLRQDDPSSLKDIVLLLTRSVSKLDESNLSVRMKFMMETINDLKNNKAKTGATAASEHVVRMKKTVGSLNTRSLRATEPLQITLTDLENSEKTGKWWLVGASYNEPAKLSVSSSKLADDGYESETPGHVSLPKLARAQGMNTDIRRAIFIAIMSASDFQDAHLRIIKLQLKNKQTLEVAKVLLHCAGAETVYNPYYTIIARKLCSEPKLQKALQSALWDVLRKVSNTDEEEDMGTNTVINLARLYGTLIAEDQISIASLKTLEFAMMPALAQTFVEVLLTTVMLRLHKSKTFEQSLQVVFAQASKAPRMVQGLQFFLRDVLSKAEITNTAQERTAVRLGCEIAIQELLTAAEAISSDDADEDDLSE